MLLIGKRILEKRLVELECHTYLRNSTCDLTVGEICPTGSRPADWWRGRSTLLLEPGDTVLVTTAQVLNLDEATTGLATLVTTLTREGILCLNVGIVDPGYRGPLSATLLNFSNKPYEITVGMRLFRTLFFDHEPISASDLVARTEDPVKYRERVRSQALSVFSRSFLDTDRAVERVQMSMLRSWGRRLVTYILPVIAVIISLVALMAGGS